MKKLNITENLHWIIPSIITALWFVIWTFSVWIIFLVISFSYVIYHFFWEKLSSFYKNKLEERINNFWKVKVFSLLFFIVFIIPIIIYFNYDKKAKIYDLASDYDLIFEEKFNWKNIIENNTFKWIYQDSNNEFTTSEEWYKTLKTSSYKQRWYWIFQDLRKLEWERILVWKFNLKEWWKVWIRFMNTKDLYSNEIMEKHNNECIIQFYDSENTWIGIWHHVTKNNFKWNESSFDYKKLTEWNYYILAKISWRQFSCYYQKEWEEQINEIIANKDIIFENLWWPVITKYIDDKKSYPEILEFQLYTKTN